MYYEGDDSDEYTIPELLRESILETIFCYLTLEEFKNCALTCKTWYKIFNDGNNYAWRYHCAMRIPPNVIRSDLLSSLRTYKAKLRAFLHAWNPYDCSRNMFVKPNGFTLHRNPIAQSTDGCRAKIGFLRGRHAWEVTWDGPLGTVAMIGVSTAMADLQYQGYVALLGSSSQSWGWNLVDSQLLHKGVAHGNFPPGRNHPKYQVGERITVVLDCENHTLSFERNHEFLGVAFKGLPSKRLFPTISAVYGNTEVSMVYLGPPLDG